MNSANQVLTHYGIAGMKWGRRSSKPKSDKPKKSSFLGRMAKGFVMRKVAKILNKKLVNVVNNDKVSSSGLKVSKMALMGVAMTSFVLSETGYKGITNAHARDIISIVENANPMNVKYNS